MTTLTFKVSDEEARQIRARAHREKLSLSEYLRRRARAPSGYPSKIRRVRCPVTGAKIFAAPEHEPPLTTEAVKDLLSDFP